MRIGTIVDRMIFGGGGIVVWDGDRRGNVWECFLALSQNREVVVYEADARSGKAWAEFKSSHEPGTPIYLASEMNQASELWLKQDAMHGRTEVVTRTEWDDSKPIADALRAHPDAVRCLTGRHQVALEWEAMGLELATRGIDCVGHNFITDLKITNSAQPSRLRWHAQRMLWHAQVTFYADACARHDIDTSGGLFLVCAEGTAPYPVTVLQLTEYAIVNGQKLCHSWLERHKACVDSGSWPGYVQGVIDLEVEGDVELEGLADE